MPDCFTIRWSIGQSPLGVGGFPQPATARPLSCAARHRSRLSVVVPLHTVTQMPRTEPKTAASELPATTDVLVVGAGFGGIDATIQLRGSGVRDVVIVERAASAAGCWQANTYPGVACDVPSNLYSYSYAPNPDWSRTYSPGGEIADYVQRVAQDFGALPHVRFGVEVTKAQWSPLRERWLVETTAGTIEARFVVGATGPLTEPAFPSISGRERFAGPQLHSARWDHTVEFAGKRVAVIGTGASAIQLVPELRKVAAQVDVYQRTAPWVLPRTDRPTTAVERWAFRHVPALQRGSRELTYWARELLVSGMRGNRLVRGALQAIGRAHLRRQVRDPGLRQRLTPRFDIGCKRILLSNAWYPALASSNVELISDRAQQFTSTGIRTADGTHRDYDVVVYGTGFHVTDPPTADALFDGEGRSLAEHWAGSPSAYQGTAIDGFPNLFMLVGPNSGVGHTSILLMIEWQNRYVAEAIRTALSDGVGTLSVRPEVMRRWRTEIDELSEGTVWLDGGCASYYVDARGRNSTVWPTWTWKLRDRLATFNLADYEVGPSAPALNAALASEASQRNEASDTAERVHAR